MKPSNARPWSTGCAAVRAERKRRHHHGGDRAPRAEHAGGVSLTSTDFNSYVTVSTADSAPQRVNGFMSASTAPGLGITPKMDVLGKPVVVVE